MGLACGDDFCVDAAERGATFGVTLVEPYDEDSNARYDPTIEIPTAQAVRCGGFDGLIPGLSLSMTLDHSGKLDSKLASCNVPTATLSELATVRVQEPAPVPFGSIPDSLAASSLRATVQERCTGRWRLAVRVIDAGRMFDAPQPGLYPSVVVVRDFAPDDPSACSLPALDEQPGISGCRDVWVARLEQR